MSSGFWTNTELGEISRKSIIQYYHPLKSVSKYANINSKMHKYQCTKINTKMHKYQWDCTRESIIGLWANIWGPIIPPGKSVTNVHSNQYRRKVSQ